MNTKTNAILFIGAEPVERVEATEVVDVVTAVEWLWDEFASWAIRSALGS